MKRNSGGNMLPKRAQEAMFGVWLFTLIFAMMLGMFLRSDKEFAERHADVEGVAVCECSR